MIKLDHFSDDGFDPIRFLTDYNPGADIFKHQGETLPLVNSNSIEKVKSKLKSKFNLISLPYSLYNKHFHMTYYGHGDDTKSLDYKYTSDFPIDEFLEAIKEFTVVDKDEDLPEISFISIRNNMPYLLTRNLPNKVEIDVENSYNLSYPLENILKDIKSDKSGLMLFTGVPGTGKTSLIKYLSQVNKDKTFCFIANNNLDILTNPSFIDFCINSLQNSIIVLEDCERALLTRDLNAGYDISNILNLTDGIYGDVLNIKIIATLNTTDKIDSALLRKGRLICQSDFKKLSIEQGRNLASKLNKNIKVNEELQLCDIYNIDDNGSKALQSTQSVVGFSIQK